MTNGLATRVNVGAGMRVRSGAMTRTAILVLIAAAAAGGIAGVALPGTEQTTAGAASFSSSGERVSARFSICHRGGGTNCVVDGDTAWIGGTKVRVADIDAPAIPVIPPHDPAPGHAARSISNNSFSLILCAANCPTASDALT